MVQSATIPDFSPRHGVRAARPSRSSVVLDSVASAVCDLVEAQRRHAGDANALASAVGIASLRLAKAATDLTAIASGPTGFALVRGPMNLDVMHHGRRIGFVTEPDSVSDRWSIVITLRLDEPLPAPFRWYFTKFDSLNAVRDFLSIPNGQR